MGVGNLYFLLCPCALRDSEPMKNKNKRQKQETRLRQRSIYVYNTSHTPSIRKGVLVPCIDTRIVDVHRHPPLTFHLKFRISNASEANVSKRHFHKNSLPRGLSPASLCQLPQIDATKVRKRNESVKYSLHFLA